MVMEEITEHDNTRALAIAILALLKQDSKKVHQQLKAMLKANRQLLACSLLTTDVEGWTPAHACALRGSKKLMKAVIQAGVAVDCTMGQPEGLPAGCTLLHVAANRKDKKIVNYLLHQGANVNAVDSNHFTALDYATRAGNKEVVRLLLTWGASPSATSPASCNTAHVNGSSSGLSVPGTSNHPSSLLVDGQTHDRSDSFSRERMSRGRSPDSVSKLELRNSETVEQHHDRQKQQQDQQICEEQSINQTVHLTNGEHSQTDINDKSSSGNALHDDKQEAQNFRSSNQCPVMIYANGMPLQEEHINESDHRSRLTRSTCPSVRPSSLHLSPRQSQRSVKQQQLQHRRPLSPLIDKDSRSRFQHAPPNEANRHSASHLLHNPVHHLATHFSNHHPHQKHRPQQKSQHPPHKNHLSKLLPKKWARLFSSTPCLVGNENEVQIIKESCPAMSHSDVSCKAADVARHRTPCLSPVGQNWDSPGSKQRPLVRRRRFSSTERIS